MKIKIALIACILINQSPLAAESWWENNRKGFIWVAAALASVGAIWGIWTVFSTGSRDKKQTDKRRPSTPPIFNRELQKKGETAEQTEKQYGTIKPPEKLSLEKKEDTVPVSSENTAVPEGYFPSEQELRSFEGKDE